MKKQNTDRIIERRLAVNIEWLKPEDTEGIDQNGRAFISDSQLYIVEPLGKGGPTFLIPGQTLRMYLDDKVITEPVSPKQGQKLEIVVPHKEPRKSLQLNISQDGLEAAIRAEVEEGLEYRLKDNPPAQKINLESELKTSSRPEPFTKEEVLSFLQKNRITYGLIEENIDYFVETQSDNYVMIARGTPQIPAVDAKIDFKVRFETEKILAHQDDLRVDYRKRFFIPSVNKDDFLAEKVAGRKGEPGRKVTGEIIPVKEPKDIDLIAGKGARLSHDSRYVYATQAGRPIYQRNLISVEPIFVVEADVDLKQGNVAFSGDVLVKGNVCPNFEVSSGGSINIYGTVVQAKVRSRSDMVLAGNVISSSIIAASSQTPYPELTKIYTQIAYTVRKVVAAVKQLKAVGAVRNILQADGQYVSQVIDLKYGELSLIVRRLQDVFIDPEDDIAETLTEINEELANKLTSFGPRRIANVDELNDLVRRLMHITRELEIRSKYTFSNVVLPYAQNSQIEATGSVNILRGCYYSNIVAGKGIVLNKESFFRGGSMVVFEGDIVAGTIGSPAGAKTEITIVKKGVVYAKEVYFNVQVCINMRRYTFSNNYTDVKLYVNSEGKLEFEGLKRE